MTRLVLLALVALQLGCAAQSHIRGYEPRHREYDAGDYDQESRPLSTGSLWQDRSRGLFSDFRAQMVGDIVTVNIDENPRAIGDATTNLDRSADISMGISGMFGLVGALNAAYPDLDTESLLGLVSASSFAGQGNTARSTNIRAAIAVRVRRVLPNGDLFIEGTKVLMINEEELHIYLSGVIRPQDITEDNSVPSSRIADAEVEFTGRGDLTQNQRQGWLSRILSEVTPF